MGRGGVYIDLDTASQTKTEPKERWGTHTALCPLPNPLLQLFCQIFRPNPFPDLCKPLLLLIPLSYLKAPQSISLSISDVGPVQTVCLHGLL